MPASSVDSDRSRLACLVNTRSGGQLGQRLLADLRALIGAEQLGDLAREAPGAFAERHHGSGRILLACGGDGTVSALLEASHAAARQTGGEPSPVAVLPLGTGNDLALALGWRRRWRPGLTAQALEAVLAGRERDLDRWLLHGPDGPQAWFNYCSWGIDARVAYAFDRLRRRLPQLFRTRLGNKAIYALLTMSMPAAPLPLDIEQPRRVWTPRWARSLIFSNIASYGGGGRLARRTIDDDGCCDGFFLGPGILLALGTRGLRWPQRTGCEASWTVVVRGGCAMQIDGEATIAAPGRYRIEHGGRVRVLAAADTAGRTG